MLVKSDMFYISDIDGALVPYSEKIYQDRLIARAELRAEGAQAGADQAASAARAREVATSQSASGAPATRTEAGASAGAMGTAGASMLHRDRTSEARGAKPTESEQAQRSREKRQRFPDEVSGVEPSASATYRVEEELELPPSSTTGVVNPYHRLDQHPQKRTPALLASQIMTSEIVSVSPEDPTRKAWRIFRERRFRHLPVVSSEGKLVGIVSDRDFLLNDPSEDKVSRLMISDVLCAHPDTEIRLIADVMFKERIGALPIVDENEQVVGMLTRTDILRTVVNEAPLELWI